MSSLYIKSEKVLSESEEKYAQIKYCSQANRSKQICLWILMSEDGGSNIIDYRLWIRWIPVKMHY